MNNHNGGWGDLAALENIMIPVSKYEIDQIVCVKEDNPADERQLSVISGKKVYYLNNTRRHHWEYFLSDRQSSEVGWFEEDEIETATPQTDDEKWWVAGGNIPTRETITCWDCNVARIDDDYDCPYCSADYDEPERSNGMDAKSSVVEMAQSLNLDDAIRVVAKSGKNHDSGPNWYVEWENLSIGATFGAGTNNATVRIISNDLAINHLMVYSADSWGRCIETFRYGPWVHRLIAHAEEIRKADEAQHKSDQAAKAETDAAKFQEVDY